ncbi:uncharacterized protein LOC143878749 [Tasmannia lanceolata]|uniref:uncharacterized protein LOC143878749 n=1 Tax=Tasmannia lanceolata TaxID=3420 RepID=UPI004062AE48
MSGYFEEDRNDDDHSDDDEDHHDGIDDDHDVDDGNLGVPHDSRLQMEVDDMFVGAHEVDADNVEIEKLTCGAMFADMKQFKQVVREYAIRQRFKFVKSKSTPKKYAVRCKEEGCKWRISGINNMTYVLVKTFVPDHTCTTQLRGNDHPLVTSAWVAKTCLRLFDRPEEIGTRIIREYIKMHWGITISYRKAYIAMNIILEIKCGNVEDSYRILPALSVEMMRRNPGTYMRVFRGRDLRPRGDDRFVRLFWTFGPSIRSFNRTLRPIVLVDGTHLRGKYLGILLIAVGVDGNNGLFPLAFAVVETENEDSWRWFLRLVRENVMSAETNVFTICSDRQKGLMQAVPIELPNANHSYCMRHLAANFYSVFKDLLLKKLFWRAAGH